MHNIDDWNDEDKLIDYLSNQLLKERLCLVLGAGVSLNFGLPLWENLINNMYEIFNEKPNIGYSNEQNAEYFHTKHCKNDYKEYKKYIQKSLYKDYDLNFNNLNTNSTLNAITALIMASKRGSSSKILTFNLDNIIEIYLSYYGFVTNSIVEPIHWRCGADVDIYHLHGYIPAPPSENFSKNLMLDKHSYSKESKESEIWKQHALCIMQTHTCLFIGLSGNDNNLDKYLTNIESSHIINETGISYWGVSFINKDEDQLILQWKKRKIFPHILEKDFKNLPSFLFKICQKAGEKRMEINK